MLPVSAHGGVVPIAFNPPTSTSTPTSNTNALTGVFITTPSTSSNTSGNSSTPHTALKETLTQLVQRHIDLCKKSLRVFAMAGRTLEMSTDTWVVLFQEYVQQSVYGEQEKAEGVFVNKADVRLELSNGFAHYAWHRIIYLIPHPLQLPSGNFTLTMLGIGNLVDTLNSTSSGSNQQKRSKKGSIDRINIVSQDVQEPKKTCRKGLS
ncbi:hypothetical protein EDC96DRAFT_605040 [Choanephora cucurbitarum]|nr:hypothetical protein EDC96DRAFT_605040 [Choanephora cucurbitarum]